MERSSLDRAVKEIFLYYDYKMPPSSRIDRIYKKVCAIPDAAVDWIVDVITDEKDTPPRNLGKEFHSLYQAWLNSGHGNRISYDKTICADCNGEGYLRYYTFVGNQKYRMIILCASCENWKAAGFRDNTLPKANIFQLEQNGYEVISKN